MKSNVATYIRVKEGKRDIEKNKDINKDIKILEGIKGLKHKDTIYRADFLFFGDSQDEIYSEIEKNLLEKTLDGYNCCIFAYGQTGSGKTYTVHGTDEKKGLIPRTLEFLHRSSRIQKLEISFIEIYNETLIDLFQMENTIGIREDPIDGAVVTGLTVHESVELDESIRLYEDGNRKKRIATTRMNIKSSRSHTVFRIGVLINDKTIQKKAKISFVDLAGSEKLKENEEERKKETLNINRSLLCLGKVVNQLSRNENEHLSYRDSKLTFLLKDSLDGRSHLGIVGTASLEYLSESLSTFQFLERAKDISLRPRRNYTMGIEDFTDCIEKLEDENKILRKELAITRKSEIKMLEAEAWNFVNRFRVNLEEIRKSVVEINMVQQKLRQSYYENEKKTIEELDQKLLHLRKIEMDLSAKRYKESSQYP